MKELGRGRYGNIININIFEGNYKDELKEQVLEMLIYFGIFIM